MLFVSEPPPHILTRKCGPNGFASSTGGPGPVFCFATPGPRSALWREDPNPRLQLVTWAFPARFLPSQAPWKFREEFPRRQTKPSAHASTGSGVLRFGTPFGNDRRDPKLNSRRTGWRLGQTRPARQELVRVPESNTKYGGKGGITGGDPAPVILPTIGESSGIPKGKKLSPPCGAHLAPAVHRAGIFSRIGIALPRLRWGYGEGRSGKPVRPWSDARITGKVRADSIPCRAP
jgi:hypothetical protein